MRKCRLAVGAKRRIYCGIKSRAKEERNALTEVARTEQREPASDVGTNERRERRLGNIIQQILTFH